MQHTIVKMKSKTLLCLSSVVAVFCGHALAQEIPDETRAHGRAVCAGRPNGCDRTADRAKTN